MVAMNNTSKHNNQGVCLHLLTQVPFIVTPSPVSIYSYRPCSRRFGPNEPRRARFVPRLLFHEGQPQSVADMPKTSGSDWPVTARNLHKRALDRCRPPLWLLCSTAQASTCVSNDLQPKHRRCATGAADVNPPVPQVASALSMKPMA